MRRIDPCLPAEAPAEEEGPGRGHRPAIVAVASKRDRIRREAADDNTEASPEIKAFFARMMRPPGS
jgi:hypothetical protein